MLPVLEFYANHTLDFENTDINTLEYHAITELRKIPIPDDILIILLDSLRSQFPGGDLSVFAGIENWSPMSMPEIKGKIIQKTNIAAIGAMGMRLVIRPQYIILPPLIYERIDWYSPQNKEKVKTIRSYYHAIISLFGGDHAIYVDEKIGNKYFPSTDNFDKSALSTFEQTLITRYGITKKSLFDYAHGKYPKYYIDHFTDIK